MISFHTLLTMFVFFIIIIKIILILSGITLIIYDHIDKTHSNNKTINSIKKMHESSEFVFKLTVSILLLLIFYPRNPRLDEINFEVMFILFIYGILTILKLNWANFLNNSLFNEISNFIK